MIIMTKHQEQPDQRAFSSDTNFICHIIFSNVRFMTRSGRERACEANNYACLGVFTSSAWVRADFFKFQHLLNR